MEILYKNKTVEQQFSSQYKNKWRYPDRVKIKLQSVENALKAASSLHDIVSFTPFHFHRLDGKRKCEWSIYLGNTGYRVVLIPCNDEGEAITEGDIIAQCKRIKVMLITEVSNHYE